MTLEAKRTPVDPDPDATDDELEDDLEDEEIGGSGPRIRCPRCAWAPRSSDRWQCYCGCIWNTFDTAGRCPDCGFQHEHTMCLACEKWSEHVAWYAEPPSQH